ncbi:hypothetical protein H9Q69_007066 [Fusarium xylarioides]|uniref:Uncharacterized protein n=1 Tax=Fusarium xylarioides TaxID=221167 RepID=A0A9P7HNE1_9HYPO|nr:hypothetical protein H9Q70_007975 [Fusarium xylarioides]KAG5763143.1 hypothetical protein H9Q72_008749 [Fusarium xylarioides]KAG5778370.1 hypothetical protein H9Q73_007952 [Fusarium xylarioides]KAG5793862.1 hypothetical protein H9Q69_007066 [Fusarium xylarioides]KAG5805055.1 hypothetical protein H9Q71_010376 [Fusarium xylarioides]
MPITIKRKTSEADLPPRIPAIPSTLPPSVEEAYRRKCVQLKNRTNEVEDANDAARLRLARIKRQVEKLRIERAFLLEQLAKRTSANVEDSDGSPSPPPTPKDKPLRTKRGHRKSMMPDSDSKAPVAASFTNTADSPNSETFSHPPESQSKPAHANGISASDSKKPTSAFELFCLETRPGLESKEKDNEIPVNIEDELNRVWKGLSDGEKDEYEAKFELAIAKNDESKKSPTSDKKDDKPAEPKQLVQDEDIEMGDDTEDQDTQAGEKVEE